MEPPSWDSIVDIVCRIVAAIFNKAAPPIWQRIKPRCLHWRQTLTTGLEAGASRSKAMLKNRLAAPIIAILAGLPYYVYVGIKWDDLQTSVTEASGIRADIISVVCLLCYLALAFGCLILLFRGARKVKSVLAR